MRRVLYRSAAGLLLVACGCAGPESPTAKPAMRALGQSVQVEQTASDETIGAEIRRRMQFADPAGTAGIVVEVHDGLVMLRGTAPDIATAWRAEALARAVPGTKQVTNRLLIPQTGPQAVQ